MYVIHKSDLTYNNYLKNIKDTRKQGAQKYMKLTFTTKIFKIFALLSFMNFQSLSSFIFHEVGNTYQRDVNQNIINIKS